MWTSSDEDLNEIFTHGGFKLEQYKLATEATTSYGIQFGCFSTFWIAHQVYFRMDLASPSYHIRVSGNCHSNSEGAGSPQLGPMARVSS